MIRRIPFSIAAKVLLGLFIAATAFQVVVLVGLVPTEMVWGGRLANEQERTVGAIVSGLILLLMIAVLLIRMERIGILADVGRYGMWVIAGLFALNTIGNVFALDPREAWIFTPVTLLAAVLAARVALGPERLP